MRIWRGIVIILIIVLALGVVGCFGGMVRREVEKSVAATLPKTIGPADKYTVRAGGASSAMMHGRIASLDIVGTNVKFKAISIARLTVHIEDIKFDTNTKKIKSVASTKYTAVISQDEINRYIVKRHSDVPGLRIELQNGSVVVYAKPGISKLRVGVQASAGVHIDGGKILALDIDTLKVAGINSPGFVRDYVESHLNTIFDISDLGLDARLKSATLSPAELTLAGDFDLLKVVGK